MLSSSFSSRWAGRALAASLAVVSLGAATLTTMEPAQAFGRFGGGGFGGGHFGGGYGGHRWLYGGGYGRGFGGGYYGHRGWGGYGYGLGGLGLGLALGSAYGGYGYGYPGYGYSSAYYGGNYSSCLRRVWGPYGPHLVNVCY